MAEEGIFVPEAMAEHSPCAQEIGGGLFFSPHGGCDKLGSCSKRLKVRGPRRTTPRRAFGCDP